jgi:hypothetical protein
MGVSPSSLISFGDNRLEFLYEAIKQRRYNAAVDWLWHQRRLEELRIHYANPQTPLLNKAYLSFKHQLFSDRVDILKHQRIFLTLYLARTESHQVPNRHDLPLSQIEEIIGLQEQALAINTFLNYALREYLRSGICREHDICVLCYFFDDSLEAFRRFIGALENEHGRQL